jgi:nicotinamide-nucleotide amidase
MQQGPAADATEQLVAELAARLTERGQRLVTAESCTGGWVAKVCTDRPGSSAWFLGGVVVYDNELKARLLGVAPATLASDGAVSEAVVTQMAIGALHRLGGDLSVAVSGIAGPDGGTAEKPVGTVWFAWAVRAGPDIEVRAKQERLPGGRDEVRRRAVLRALEGVLGA